MTQENVIESLFTYRLHALKKLTDRTMNEAFAQALSLTLAEARILLSAGSFGPLSVSDLGKVSNLDRSQASRATDILERKGLLEKTSNQHDGRGVVVVLTSKGRSTFRRATVISKARNDEILSVLSVKERDALDATLAKLIDNYGDTEGGK